MNPIRRAHHGRSQSLPSKRLIQAGVLSPEIFSGWKEIANYLGMAVRSLQRYERVGLPIHRPSGKSKGAVIARKVELDAWITNGHIEADSMPNRWPTDRTDRVGAMFLQCDSEIALTFAGLALEARDEEKRRRTTGVARRAYDTIIRLRQNLQLTDAERHKLDSNLLRLKSELITLGEDLPADP